MSSAIKTPAFQAKAGNIQNEDGSSIYSNGDWSLKNSTAVASVTIKDDGSVGIGTASPIAQLEASEGFTTRGIAAPTNTSVGSIQLGYDGTSGVIRTWNSSPISYETYGHHQFLVDDTERMRIDASGAVTIGSTTAVNDSKLRAGKGTPVYVWRDTNGSNLIIEKLDSLSGGDFFVAFSSSAADIGGGSVVGGIRRNAGNTAFEFYNASDERLKDVKGEFDGAVEMVKGIPVKWYAWKTDPSKEHFRFIAQDVQKHIPSAVSEDENGHLMLGESDMFPVLWQAVREQQAQIEELKAKVSALESK